MQPEAARTIAAMKQTTAQRPVEIEDEATWPEPFITAVRDHKALAVSYQRERSRIDKLCQDDVFLRIDPPTNRFKLEYEGLFEALDPMLREHRLLAYHCTRLTPHEVDNVRMEGLRILSANLVKQKIDDCYTDGWLSRDEYDHLRASESIVLTTTDRWGKRVGLLSFCPNRSTLSSSMHVHRLFRSWGGEAIYAGHEEDAAVSKTLRRIGSPYIVKCGIPFRDIPCKWPEYAQRFLAQFVRSEVEYPEPPADFDLFSTQPLQPDNVITLIGFHDPEFLRLTQHDRWNPFDRIAGPHGAG